MSTDATYDSVAVVFEAGGETFKLQGKVLINPGFLEVMTWHLGDEQVVPDFKKNELVSITNSKIIDGMT